jgi:hypothetical protein
VVVVVAAAAAVLLVAITAVVVVNDLVINIFREEMGCICSCGGLWFWLGQ